ncbi:MAG TPA: hypothetical protein VGJ60_11395 [Chloroflexota bacterium]
MDREDRTPDRVYGAGGPGCSAGCLCTGPGSAERPVGVADRVERASGAEREVLLGRVLVLIFLFFFKFFFWLGGIVVLEVLVLYFLLIIRVLYNFFEHFGFELDLQLRQGQIGFEGHR